MQIIQNMKLPECWLTRYIKSFKLLPIGICILPAERYINPHLNAANVYHSHTRCKSNNNFSVLTWNEKKNKNNLNTRAQSNWRPNYTNIITKAYKSCAHWTLWSRRVGQTQQEHIHIYKCVIIASCWQWM